MKLITFAELGPKKGIHYCRDHLRRKWNSEEFPRPIPLSNKRIAWNEAEIDAWISAKIHARDEKKAAA